MPLIKRLNARALAILGAGKYNDGFVLLLHKKTKFSFFESLEN
ncbi:hypothetical protein O9A_00634 [Bartonella koehlerae C-29]|uniref:Uncharacterized protein n=1 Tax=Bartonella koehlerae C-29 TaxID=1134510 RepID=A0A067W6E9_9HYPH|nr:hypothetical protein O9A_00634 [Bartonella koehlerae C-29]